MTVQQTTSGPRSDPSTGARGERRWVDVHDAAWYLALDVAERRDLLRKAPERCVTPGPGASEIIEEWRSAPAFRTPDAFAVRLARLGLSEAEFEHIVGQPPEVLRDCHEHAPDWLVSLDEAFTPGYLEAAARLAPPCPAEPRMRLLGMAKPIIARGVARLRARTEAARARGASQRLDLSDVEACFLPGLFDEISFHCQRALALELHVFRVQGRLTGKTAEERFDDFARQLSDPDVAVRLLREYCVLARRLVRLVDDWVRVTVEFLERLVADWGAIRDRFGMGAASDALAAAHRGGDRHRGGRAVYLVEFRSRFRLVYKPRSMAVDQHFQDLVRWINRHLDDIDVRTARVLDRGEYGWMEFLGHREVASREAVRRFYQRLGAHLALLYALNATDMHQENVIAAGEHPFIVDLETLFHTYVGGAAAQPGDIALKAFASSVC